ncbi:Zn(2)-C6 fungal-type domain-containing protein [Fusarium sp. LHS14.1]|nr:Zn(2)-C6 fungal-type domain-containing protein [Fusarium sp. LHS14.1]
MPMQRRHRSTVACQECRGRKVRCSVTVTGIPCMRCAQDGIECIVQDGHHTLPHSSLNASSARNARSRSARSGDQGNSSRASPSLPEPITHQPASVPDVRRGDSMAEDHNDTAYHSDPGRQRDIEEERSGAEISSAATGQGIINSNCLFYLGEQPGATSVIDVCSHPQKPIQRHILLRSAPPVTISQQDSDYLKQKGVFNLPQQSSRKEILRAYFHHVHPILPILDVGILQNLHEPIYVSLSDLLLFWSMTSVAVNFVPSTVWQLEGFGSCKQMKATAYEHAKCVYNNGGVIHQEHLLQSALLLSFWHSDRDRLSQPWYWSGVAVSLCQIIGLHRNPDSVRLNPLINPRRRRMWRRLWGGCLFRDRWLSMTLGRPMRIRLGDCDMPFPTVEDLLGDVAEIPSSLRDAYLPQDLDRLAKYWPILLQLSRLLGDVTVLCYQPNNPPPSLEQCECLEAELSQHCIPDVNNGEESQLERFYYYHAQLHYQALLITFYRPCVSMTPKDLQPPAQGPWQNRMRTRLASAAASTNAVLDSIVREELVDLACPMTPPLLVPAMHVHLLDCKSQNPLTRKLGFNKLEFCMEVMREFQKTYTSASVFCGIFGEAIRQLSPDHPDQSDAARSQPATRASNSMQNDGGGIMAGPADADSMLISDDLLQSLLSEGSEYNLWESINMMEQPFDFRDEVT